MLARLILTALTLLGLAAPATATPKMRICTSTGAVSGASKIYFGSGELFYAGLVDPDDPTSRFRPDKALRDVEWWMYRTQDLAADNLPLRDGALRREVAHRAPPGKSWAQPAHPFAVPDHLKNYWSSGRYAIRARHPRHGEARIRVTIATILLLDHEARREADSYEARFRVALADPDLLEAKTPLEVAVVDRSGRTVDRFSGVFLVRDGPAYVSPRPVRLSSRVPDEIAAERRAGSDQRWPVLRVVPDSRLRVTVGDRVFQFPVPLEEGLLVRRSGSVPFGREGSVLLASGIPARGLRAGGFGKPDTRGSHPGSRRPRSSGRGAVQRPDHAGRPPDSGDGESYRTPRALGRGEQEMEVVSDAGRARRLKLWMGESATFAARLRPRGLEDLFTPGDWLRDVHWTLFRVSLPTDRRAIAIIPGTSIAEVGRMDPLELWGAPPALFVCPDDVHGKWRPGLYVLRASRRDSPPSEVRLDVAAFELTDVEADLREGHYLMSLRLRLTDPFETRDRVPVGVRVIGKRDEIHDEIRGVVLSRDLSRRDEFVSRRVRFSTKVKRPCKDRYEGKDPRHSASAPGTLKVVPGSRLRVVLDGAVFTYPLPLALIEILVGSSRPTGRPAGD